MGFILNREKGEPYDKWAARNKEANLRIWEADKKARGEWLSKEEYEKETGLPGKDDMELGRRL